MNALYDVARRSPQAGPRRVSGDNYWVDNHSYVGVQATAAREKTVATNPPNSLLIMLRQPTRTRVPNSKGASVGIPANTNVVVHRMEQRQDGGRNADHLRAGCSVFIITKVAGTDRLQPVNQELEELLAIVTVPLYQLD